MQETDPNITWIEEPKLGLAGRMYLPLIMGGLTTTSKHLVGKKVTVSYPDEEPEIGNPLIYRGVHRLNKDAQGRVKCVACFLCATACPAHCIDIVGIESPWEDREKYPESFSIDELRCIYCGMCEEACPVDAIELTSLYNLTGRSREEMIFDKEKLLSVYDATKNKEPMKSAGVGDGRRGGCSLMDGFTLLAQEEAVASGLFESLTAILTSPLGRTLVCVGLATVGILLLLPPLGRGKPFLVGAVLTALALVVTLWPSLAQLSPSFLFFLLEALAVLGGLGTVTSRSPIYSAIWFASRAAGHRRAVVTDRRSVFGTRHRGGLCGSDRRDLPVCADVGPTRRTRGLRSAQLGLVSDVVCFVGRNKFRGDRSRWRRHDLPTGRDASLRSTSSRGRGRHRAGQHASQWR